MEAILSEDRQQRVSPGSSNHKKQENVAQKTDFFQYFFWKIRRGKILGETKSLPLLNFENRLTLFFEVTLNAKGKEKIQLRRFIELRQFWTQSFGVKIICILSPEISYRFCVIFLPILILYWLSVTSRHQVERIYIWMGKRLLPLTKWFQRAKEKLTNGRFIFTALRNRILLAFCLNMALYEKKLNWY